MSCEHIPVEVVSSAPTKVAEEVVDPKLSMIQQAVRILNEAYRKDPMAIRRLLTQTVQANFGLATMDHIVNEDERATTFKVTAFGLLNGVLGPLTGYLVVVAQEDGVMKGFGYQKASDRY